MSVFPRRARVAESPPSVTDHAPGQEVAGAFGVPDPSAVQEVAEQTAYGEVFLSELVTRQLTLSLAVAATFLGIVFAIPLFNLFLPGIANVHVFGFTLSWLLLGFLIYPLIFGLAYYFVGTAKKYEDEFTRMVK